MRDGPPAEARGRWCPRPDRGQSPAPPERGHGHDQFGEPGGGKLSANEAPTDKHHGRAGLHVSGDGARERLPLLDARRGAWPRAPPPRPRGAPRLRPAVGPPQPDRRTPHRRSTQRPNAAWSPRSFAAAVPTRGREPPPRPRSPLAPTSSLLRSAARSRSASCSKPKSRRSATTNSAS